MVCISVLIFLFCGINLLPVTLGSPDTLTLVAEPGHDVTIWCQHNLMEVAYIYWFTHTNHSVPHHVACQLYKKSSASSPCSFVHQSKRMVMSVNSQNTSLTITAVNHTDSGLYYCGIRQSLEISFSNTTYLQVTEQNKILLKTRSGGERNETLSTSSSEAHCPPDVYFMLTVVFGGVSVILIGVLLVTLKRRKQHRDVSGSKVKQHKEEQDPNSVNYAALQFSDRKTRRVAGHGEVVDTHVVLSSVRH